MSFFVTGGRLSSVFMCDDHQDLAVGVGVAIFGPGPPAISFFRFS